MKRSKNLKKPLLPLFQAISECIGKARQKNFKKGSNSHRSLSERQSGPDRDFLSEKKF